MKRLITITLFLVATISYAEKAIHRQPPVKNLNMKKKTVE